MSIAFHVDTTSGKARCGRLLTPHAEIETPVFMPVGTQATVKGLLPRELIDDLDAKMQAIASEFEKSAREGREPDEMTGKVWSLDQRQLLNTKAWLEGNAE